MLMETLWAMFVRLGLSLHGLAALVQWKVLTIDDASESKGADYQEVGSMSPSETPVSREEVFQNLFVYVPNYPHAMSLVPPSFYS
jgi:hypothetical protein